MHLKPIRPLVTLARVVLPVVLLTGLTGTLPAGDTVDAAQTAVFEPTIHADRPYAVTFEPRQAKLIRVFIRRSSNSQPCIDELEVFTPQGESNLALASGGAKATASSCLDGYAIHQIPHLNDGQYGNAHSWIAATASNEWAQIELVNAAIISKVVISRDREGRYHDRVPVAFDIQLSLDGEHWRTACHVVAKAAVAPSRQPRYAGPFKLSPEPDWDELLDYAFACERHTWERMSKDDHLSPLATDRPARAAASPIGGASRGSTRSTGRWCKWTK